MDQMMFVNVIATLKRAHWNAHKENKFGHIDLATGLDEEWLACQNGISKYSDDS